MTEPIIHQELHTCANIGDALPPSFRSEPVWCDSGGGRRAGPPMRLVRQVGIWPPVDGSMFGRSPWIREGEERGDAEEETVGGMEPSTESTENTLRRGWLNFGLPASP